MKLKFENLAEYLDCQAYHLEKSLKESDLFHQEDVDEDHDLVPTTLIIPLEIQNSHNEQLLMCLLDSGASDTIIRRDKLPPNVTPKILQHPIHSNTLIWQQEIKNYVELRNIILPEFSHSYKIEYAKAYVVESKHCNYDIIIGRDFLRSNKIDMSFKSNTISWMNEEIAIKHNSNNKHQKNQTIFSNRMICPVKQIMEGKSEARNVIVYLGYFQLLMPSLVRIAPFIDSYF
jgi:hypothetical protein